MMDDITGYSTWLVDWIRDEEHRDEALLGGVIFVMEWLSDATSDSYYQGLMVYVMVDAIERWNEQEDGPRPSPKLSRLSRDKRAVLLDLITKLKMEFRDPTLSIEDPTPDDLLDLTYNMEPHVWNKDERELCGVVVAVLREFGSLLQGTAKLCVETAVKKLERLNAPSERRKGER